MDNEKEILRVWLSKSLLMDIDSDTIFFKDIGLAEEDIETFFNEFVDHYKIDATEFNYENYSSEKLNILDKLIRRKKIKTFTLDHLYEVVKRKKWFDPV